jgi:hypothetical protein
MTQRRLQSQPTMEFDLPKLDILIDEVRGMTPGSTHHFAQYWRLDFLALSLAR